MECGVSAATLSEEGDVLRVTRRGVQKVAQTRIKHLAVLESPEGAQGDALVSWDMRRNAPIVTRQKKAVVASQNRRPRRRPAQPPVALKRQERPSAQAA
jgi:hypothetical protein